MGAAHRRRHRCRRGMMREALQARKTLRDHVAAVVPGWWCRVVDILGDDSLILAVVKLAP